MVNTTDAEQLTVTSNYISNLLEYLQSQGKNTKLLLELSNVKEEIISNPQGKISFQQFRRLFLNAIKLSNDPALGLHLGSQLNITAHGLLGYAVMSSANLKDALKLVIKYFQIRTPLAKIALQTNQNLCHIKIECCYPLGDFKYTFIETVVSGLTSMLSYLTGINSPTKEVHFAYPAPDYQQQYNAVFNCKITFDAPQNEVVFSSELLKQSLILSDTAANKIAIEKCEEALIELLQEKSVIQQIEQLLFSAKGKFPSFEKVADKLHTTPRTLRRKLKQQSQSFQEILGRVRFRLAKEHLSSENLSIQEISYLLGYSDPSNFGRAFKKWSDCSPQGFRENHSIHQ